MAAFSHHLNHLKLQSNPWHRITTVITSVEYKTVINIHTTISNVENLQRTIYFKQQFDRIKSDITAYNNAQLSSKNKISLVHYNWNISFFSCKNFLNYALLHVS